MKKLSIIVPCYKVEKYLPRCLDSLMNQTLEDIEAICINDGSPDRCIDILKEYKNKYGDKIVIIDKKNEGVWKGRKDGVKAASGEYIGFVDSDDYVNEKFAEKLYNAAKRNNADIAVCGFDRIDLITGKLYSREMCKDSKKSFNISTSPQGIINLNGAPWNKIYKAHLLKDMDDLKNPPKILDDLMFQLLIYIHSDKVVYIPDSLIYYMIRSDSIINTISKEQVDSTYRSMLEVRDIYTRTDKTLLGVLDTVAFLHLGISLMYRLSYDKNCNLKQAIKRKNKFLDKEFPSWRKSPYMTLGYVVKNRFDNLKLWIVRCTYRFHLFGAFLAVYRFMIDKLKVDIKW